MSDIVFTKDGKRYVIPHTLNYKPTQEHLEQVRSEYPDAEIVPTVSDDDWYIIGYTSLGPWTAYLMKEPRT